jgi:hypothetical protein
MDVPNSVPNLVWSPIFEQCMVGFESKNGHHKEMCRKEIGLCAQSLLFLLDIVVNITRGIDMIIC